MRSGWLWAPGYWESRLFFTRALAAIPDPAASGGTTASRASRGNFRASLYRYRFTTLVERRATGQWWVRTPTAELVLPLSLAGSRWIAE